MADLTITYDGELMVAQILGNTEKGIEFVDAWVSVDLYVHDMGNIIVKEDDLPFVRKGAAEWGLTVEETRQR